MTKTLASQIPDDKPLWQLTVGEFKALVCSGAEKSDDELLTVEKIEAEFAIKLGSLKAAAARNELALVRGGKRRIMARRGDVVAWIRSRPVTPRLRKTTPLENEDPIDAMLRHGELVSTKKARAR